jgi:copper oxidase (laccase) domain-containing protein
MGTVRRIISAAIQAMQDKYRSQPADLLACIGPSIGAHHYPVGAEVVSQVEAAFVNDAAALLESHNGSQHLDLWQANRLLLEQAGVRYIQNADICTACHLDDWYSHRGEQGNTGRFGVVIGL